jgi:hypothetical protein
MVAQVVVEIPDSDRSFEVSSWRMKDGETTFRPNKCFAQTVRGGMR